MAAWGVAGAAAYFLWVLPEQRREQEAEDRRALARLKARIPWRSLFYSSSHTRVFHQTGSGGAEASRPDRGAAAARRIALLHLGLCQAHIS